MKPLYIIPTLSAFCMVGGAVFAMTLSDPQLWTQALIAPFTNQNVTLTATCNNTYFRAPGCSQESYSTGTNGTYTLKSVTNTNITKYQNIEVNYIDKTLPKYTNIRYFQGSDLIHTTTACTKDTVTAKVTYIDGLNSSRATDRISGFGDNTQYERQYYASNSLSKYGEKLIEVNKPYTWTQNGSKSLYTQDLAGNQSNPFIQSVNWIKNTSPTISDLVLTPGLTGMVPFSFDIVDTSESNLELSSSCKGQTINWAVSISSNGIQIAQNGTGKAGDHITGTLSIPSGGDYSIQLTLTDSVGNKSTKYGTMNADGSTTMSDIPTNITQSTESKVKILGSIGGQGAFDSVYSVGSKFDSSLFATTLNHMRKNIALMTRNIPEAYYNSNQNNQLKPLNRSLFIKERDILYSNIAHDFPSTTTDSLILIGGDLIIDNDITTTDTIRPKGIIVMKDEAGRGGNIYISGSVRQIQSSIFTEGSIYSGDDATHLYNDTLAKLTSLPANQLYIYGSLISRNTILGGLSGICVYAASSCTSDQAYSYDLNYFRNFTGADTNRAYGDNTLDAYSVVIERDPRIGSTPPPGFDMR